jgi:N-acetylglutamate synthase-like GNAT family acetyltransferase
MAEWKNQDGFLITTNPSMINLNKLHHYLSKKAYWSLGIPLEIVQQSVENSVCFSVISPANDYIGFARVVTDLATFGYLADVFIIDEYKGIGLGKWLMEIIMNFPEFKTLRNWFLYTKDAHGLYEKFGWKRMDKNDRAMNIQISASKLYSN